MDRKLYQALHGQHEHPSNALYRGEITGFLNGLTQLRAAIATERRWLDSDDDPGYSQRLYAVIDQARAVYLSHVQAAEQAAAAEMRSLAFEMTGNEQEQMDLLALACETGDLSVLAI